MRNLKRALSLTLASVMLLGMMVVGAGAASYPDVDEKDNIEAIEVLQAVKVMVGDEKGNFGPDQPVNRAQMAVVMALLLDLDYDYYEGTNPFKDVPAWAAPYVAACYANGIVSGYDAYTYGSGDPVTAVQAASMMMRALGYFKYPSDYSNNGGFELATVKQASKIDLFRQINANAKDPLTRNQVAQLALNALKTPIVEADDKTISWVDGSGNVIASGGQVNYVVTASSQAYARAIDDAESKGNALNGVSGYIIELGEKLYNGKLKLTDDIDAFNRPARNWEFEGKTIGLYAKKELMEMENVGTVTGKDLYDLLGKTKVSDYSIEVALDGVTDPEIVFNAHKANGESGYDDAGSKKNVHFVFDKDDINRSNNGSLGATGTGVLTQVFVDPDYDNGTNRPSGKVWIAVINTYLARASQDYDSKREELTLNAYSVVKSSGEYVKLDKNSAAQQVRLSVEEFPAVKDAKESDAFLVTFAEGEVQSAVPAEVLSEVKVSSFKKSDNVVVDGTTYKFTTTAGFETGTLKTDYTGDDLINLKDRVYNIFLDAYDNLIGVQLVDEVKNYVFISALDLNDSNLVNGTANAKALFLDGTVDTIRVNMDKSDIAPYENGAKPGGYNKNSILNTWCTYTKNNSDVYTVKQVADVSANGDDYLPGGSKGGSLAQYHQTAGNTEFKIDKKHITLDGNNAGNGTYARVYGNEKTVYLTAELSNLTNQGGVWGVIKDVDSVTTGVENANLLVWTDQDAANTAGTDKVTIGALKPVPKDDDPNYASKGVYTLYNKDGIVIAAVVVGEDDGTARNLVYAHTGDIDWESYNGEGSTRADGDGLFTWTRKVISDGQEITLTEVSDGNSDLAAMAQYHWYQIKTNGDGEVTGVYRMPEDKIGDNAKHNKLDVAKLTRLDDLALDYKVDYVEEEKDVTQGEIAYTIQNGANNILYWNRDYIESNLYMDGRTLYVATDDDYGFIVNSNVKWVVQQWDNNAKETYIDEGTTAAGLDNMIKELNRRNTNREGEIEHYHYQVSAIIESGIASSVVIFYNENDYNRPNGGGTTEGVEATVDLTGVLSDAKVYDAKDVEIEGVAIRGGNRFTVKTGDVITVVDTDIANEKFEAAATPAANAEIKKADGDLKINVKGDVVVNGVIGATETGKTYTLTVTDAKLAAATSVMYSTDGGATWTNAVKKTAPAGAVYDIPGGAKVAFSGGLSGLTVGIQTINGQLVDVTAATGPVYVTMPNAAYELSTLGSSTLTKFTAGKGVTLTWTKQDGNALDAEPMSTVNEDGTTTWYVTATSGGAGAAYKWKANVDTINVADADTFAAAKVVANTATGADSDKPVVLAATTVTLTNAELFDGEDQVTDTNIAIGKTLTVKPASGYDGVVDTTVAGTITGANVTSVTVTKPVTLSGAYTVTLGDGLTSDNVVSGELVVDGEEIEIEVDASKGKAADVGVFDKVGTDNWALAADIVADLTAVEIDGTKNFVVGTKVTTDANTDVLFWNMETGNKDEVVGKGAGNAAYVIEGTVIQGEAANTVTVKVGANNIDDSQITSGTNGVSGTVKFRVGTEAITLTGT